MKVVLREAEKLNLNNPGFLAQKRLALGLRLNHPKAAALIATQNLEFVRNGDKSLSELMDIGRQLLGRKQLLPGVQYLLDMVQLEILEVLTKGGASHPACEEALLEASYLGRARSAEMLMGSNMIPALRRLCMLLFLLAAEASLM